MKGEYIIMNAINVMPMVRKTLIGAAIVGGALTTASLFKTPGKTLNPQDPPLYATLLDTQREFGYDETKSVMHNVGTNAEAAIDKLFDNVIDPITEKPILPATATVLAMLGARAAKTKENAAEEITSNETTTM